MKRIDAPDSSTSQSAITAQFASLDNFDHEAARREGWALSDCGSYGDGTPHIELQKLDNPPSGAPRFSEDKDAWSQGRGQWHGAVSNGAAA